MLVMAVACAPYPWLTPDSNDMAKVVFVGMFIDPLLEPLAMTQSGLNGYRSTKWNFGINHLWNPKLQSGFKFDNYS